MLQALILLLSACTFRIITSLTYTLHLSSSPPSPTSSTSHHLIRLSFLRTQILEIEAGSSAAPPDVFHINMNQSAASDVVTQQLAKDNAELGQRLLAMQTDINLIRAQSQQSARSAAAAATAPAPAASAVDESNQQQQQQQHLKQLQERAFFPEPSQRSGNASSSNMNRNQFAAVDSLDAAYSDAGLFSPIGNNYGGGRQQSALGMSMGRAGFSAVPNMGSPAFSRHGGGGLGGTGVRGGGMGGPATPHGKALLNTTLHQVTHNLSLPLVCTSRTRLTDTCAL